MSVPNSFSLVVSSDSPFRFLLSSIHWNFDFVFFFPFLLLPILARCLRVLCVSVLIVTHGDDGEHATVVMQETAARSSYMSSRDQRTVANANTFARPPACAHLPLFGVWDSCHRHCHCFYSSSSPSTINDSIPSGRLEKRLFVQSCLRIERETQEARGRPRLSATTMRLRLILDSTRVGGPAAYQTRALLLDNVINPKKKAEWTRT